MQNYDVAIIGAGPAGLAAAQRLSRRGHRIIIIDQGRAITERDKTAEAELTQGHGGAGLYSDGKFSFFPSATHLWHLPRREALHDAYTWTCSLLNAYGLDTPPFPSDANAYTPGVGDWVLKSYPSNYLSLEARLEMVFGLVSGLDADIASRTRLTSYRYDASTKRHHLGLQNTRQYYEIITQTLIWATGRFGAFELDDDIKKTFRRLEVGFRIEQPSELAFFQPLSNLDPKLTLRAASDAIEWRTFCACRNGRTVLTQTQGLWTVSGHSDGPPSQRSNVGFNTRILDEALARRTIETIGTALREHGAYYEIPLMAWFEGQEYATSTMDAIYGRDVAEAMLQGLRQLIHSFPAIKHDETILIGPTLEGIGWYPEVDGTLRIPGRPTWVVGDACGLFRGIVAAFISGHYAASSVLETLEEYS
ncbi:FAD-dependent oxidoreductase [Chromohalobacter sp. 296-RDG]|uniref:FAD-dependent oxidoreductase n=1 Tax=Chromohalobacter sp. 296-RDG TaxID=2994062 RepID=UPI0024693AAF|nr:FAD-dependent oxidoreductase [Chromohalobacter sp. 296-RDG]